MSLCAATAQLTISQTPPIKITNKQLLINLKLTAPQNGTTNKQFCWLSAVRSPKSGVLNPDADVIAAH